MEGKKQQKAKLLPNYKDGKLEIKTPYMWSLYDCM